MSGKSARQKGTLVMVLNIEVRVLASSIPCNAERQRKATRPTAFRTLTWLKSQQCQIRCRYRSAYNLTTNISSSSIPRLRSKPVVQHPPTACTSRQALFAFDWKVVSKGYRDNSKRLLETTGVQYTVRSLST